MSKVRSEDAPAADAPAARPRRLIVLVPGMNNAIGRWAPLKDRLLLEPGYRPEDADWLDFDHRTTLWSAGTIDAIAHELRAEIHAQWVLAGGYAEVVLVGYSMGGLIARQAYLLAAGAVPGADPSDWGGRVSRIVLLASVNRGTNPKDSWTIWLLAWLVRRVRYVCRFRATDAVRGSDFLTNLRINWIRHFGSLDKARRDGAAWPDGRPKGPPLVVQLLGTADGTVRADDSRDVLAFPNGHYREVPGARHDDVYRLDLASAPDARYAVLLEGFTGLFPDRAQAAFTVRRVVFVLHGIRASNVDDWIKSLAEKIRSREEGTEVLCPTYLYFSAAQFTLPSVRKRNITFFQDCYTEALAKYPTAEFHAVAHSNGTYLLGQSLMQTPGMRFKNIALAGSVLPADFEWKRLFENGQVCRVRNDRADRDWPVALMCNALRGLRMRDIGTGGFAGFKGLFTGDEMKEVAYHPGGHGVALLPTHSDFLVDFIGGKPNQEPPGLRPAGYFRQLSNAMPYAAVLLVTATALGIFWCVFAGGDIHCDRALLWTAIALVVYVLLDIV